MTGQDAEQRAEEIKRLLAKPPVTCGCVMPCNHWTPRYVDTLATAISSFVDAAVAEALKERDAEIARLQAICDDNSHKFALHQEALIEARREERERLAKWNHVCALEACCIENGLHATSPPASAPEGGA